MNSTRRAAPSVDDAIEVIRAFVRYMQWSNYDLAKAAKMERSSLRHFRSDDWSPKADTLRVLYSLIPPDFDPSKAPKHYRDTDRSKPDYSTKLRQRRQINGPRA